MTTLVICFNHRDARDTYQHYLNLPDKVVKHANVMNRIIKFEDGTTYMFWSGSDTNQLYGIQIQNFILTDWAHLRGDLNEVVEVAKSRIRHELPTP